MRNFLILLVAIIAIIGAILEIIYLIFAKTEILHKIQHGVWVPFELAIAILMIYIYIQDRKL